MTCTLNLPFLKRSFSESGSHLWNKVPEEVRTATALDLFKRGTHCRPSHKYPDIF